MYLQVLYYFTENEYIFLDPDSKLYKYAPKGWLKHVRIDY